MKYFVFITLIIFSFCYSFSLNAQTTPPTIKWQGVYGGSSYDGATSIIQLSNGSYIIAGSTESSDGDLDTNSIYSSVDDYWLVKLDTNGVIVWQRTFGGLSHTSLSACANVQYTGDGFIFAGETGSADGGEVSGEHGYYDYWIVKTDTAGIFEWGKCLGGSNYDFIGSITTTSDSGYFICGYTYSHDGDVTRNYYDTSHGDIWAVKLDYKGNILWEHCYGGSRSDYGYWGIQTKDKGYVIAGSTLSNDGEVSGYRDSVDALIVKIDSNGKLQWTHTYGGTNMDEAFKIIQTNDGGYVAAGYTRSNNDDISFNHGLYDGWVFKIDSIGNLKWSKTYGGSDADQINYIQQASDSGFIIFGTVKSLDGDVSGNHGESDMWLVKTNDTGKILWQKCYGGSGSDAASSFIETNRGLVLAGGTQSHDDDISTKYVRTISGYNHGVEDMWIVNLQNDSGIISSVAPVLQHWQPKVYPTLTNGIIYIDLPDNTNAQIKLYNLSGQIEEISITGAMHKTLNLQGLPDGIYILQVAGNKTTKYYKIQVHH